jgi:hypothetical protein
MVMLLGTGWYLTGAADAVPSHGLSSRPRLPGSVLWTNRGVAPQDRSTV